jgi:hypothetical protein
MEGRTATALEGIYYCTCLKKGDKTDYSDYRGISPLLTTYKISSSIFVSNLIP